jgi:uncharacterized protein (DUF302 family)
MNPNNLRLLWSVVMESSPEKATELPCEVLVKNLLQQMNDRILLSLDEQMTFKTYLDNRKGLVHEMLQVQAI